MGIIYEHALLGVVVFSVLAQLLAVVGLIIYGRKKAVAS